MHLKKFFTSANETSSEQTTSEELNFKAEPQITDSVTCAIKKLMDHKNIAPLSIGVLCDLSKQHCAMCESEQECSDNPLLFNPVFVRQYIQEYKPRQINKQSVCTKCKLQLSKHLIINQVQNDTQNAQISSSEQNFDFFFWKN